MAGFLDSLRLNFKYAFRPHKPKLFFRLVKTFLGIILLGKRPLRYVDFAIDYRCNLSCEHCFKTALEKTKDGVVKMGVEDYRRVAEESMALGAVNFSFQGGEVFLHPELEQIVKAVRPDLNLVSLTTNGTMLTEANVKKVRSWGVDILTVSLDSGVPEEHDKFRGMQGTFEKAVKGIDFALANGLNVTVGTTVSHSNLHSEGIKMLMDYAKNKKVILNLILAAPAGNWKDNAGALVTDEDMAYIKKLTRETPYIRTDFQANFWDYGCGAAKEILYLTPYGDVLTCPFIHISFGNVLKESVDEVRSKMLANKYFSTYYHTCLAAEDHEFIEKYQRRANASETFPADHESVFRD